VKNIVNSKICLKCRGCCYFDENEKYLAPFFSNEELSKISSKTFRDNFKKKSGKLLQIKLSIADDKIGKLKCPLLDEKTHQCLIYEKRPFECMLWPFFIGWDKHEKDVFLYVANKNWCKLSRINKIEENRIVNYFIKYFVDAKIFDKIKKGDIAIWPYKSGHRKIKKITQFIF